MTSVSGASDSASPLLTADGRWVFFASTADNLVTNDSNGLVFDLFARNLSENQTFLLTPGIGGAGANGSSMPESVSSNGTFLAFTSDASNLVPNDTNGFSDVFVRDRVNNQTILVSVAQNGATSGKGASSNASITPDGRYVVFESDADNLTSESNQNLGVDVFLRDLQAGRTTLISAGYAPSSNTTRVFDSHFPSVTPDGRYVAFVSTAANLVPGATNTQVYVRDVQAGVTYWASTNVPNFQALFSRPGFISYKPILSDDGRYVIFKTYSDLVLDGNVVIFRHDIQAGTTEVIAEHVAGEDPNYDSATGPEASSNGNIIAYVKETEDLSREVYVWDAASRKETLISTNLPGIDADAVLFSDTPLVSSDGRYVLFMSAPFDELSGFHIYQYDRTSGTAQLVNPHSGDSEEGELDVQNLSMSADGRVIAFDSSADDLVGNDSNKSFDVFLRNLDRDAIELISQHDKSAPAITPNGQSTLAHNGVDGAGRYVVFTSKADNLTPGDENGAQDVFVKDLATGKTLPVSIALDGSMGDGQSRDPAISRDGRYIVFSSVADNLVANDTNNVEDVFLRDLQAGTTALISASFEHTSNASGSSFSPSISDDGRFIAFQSFATNLVSGIVFPPPARSSIFLYDMVAGKSALASPPLISAVDESVTPTISPSGHYIIYQNRALDAGPSPQNRLYRWLLYDRLAGTNRFIATATAASFPLTDSASPPVFDRSEQWLAFPFQISPTTRVENEIGLMNLAEAGQSSSQICSNCSTPSISDDGKFISYQTFSSNSISRHGVWIYDRAANQSIAISTNLNSTITDSSGRFDPVISGDGRYVTFQSRTPAPGENDIKTFLDVFLFDRNSGETQLISRSPFTGGPGGNSSLAPIFSPDNRMLLFNSYAPDLVSGDYNSDSDIFFVPLDSNPASNLALKLTLDSGAATIQWNSVSGQAYQVQYKNELSDAAWVPLGGVKTGTGSTVSVTDPAISRSNHRFYRVSLVQ